MKYKRFVIWGIVLAVLWVFCLWQNDLLTISRYRFHSEGITAELDGYTIVQISDLHNKRFGAGQERLLKTIRECEPDIIVITGDLVDSTWTDIDKAMTFVEGAVQIAPVYYVSGNHEMLLEESVGAELLQRLWEAGVVLLDNDWVEVFVGEDSFLLLGLGDHSLQGSTLQRLCETAQEEAFLKKGRKATVLLAHEPQYIGAYSSQDVDLVLAGHAHGGQFRLPLVGGVIAPGQGFFPKYTAGTYREGRTEMIVSRGLGNSVIPLRLFNYPDVVCVRFSAEE